MVIRPTVALMLLCSAILHGQGQPVRAIAGIVRDTSGAPIPDVDVEALPGPVRARSGIDGIYRLNGLTPGLTTVSARRIGFRPLVQAISMEADRDRRLDIVLLGSVATLNALNVTARPEVFEARLAGFNARSTKQVGHFVTRERIDRANSTRLSDMLREIPGVRVVPTPNQGRVVRIRGSQCPPLVFVDGFPATAGEFDLDIIDLQSVEGIEVYAGMGSIPAEFLGPRDLDRCGVIGIWSRPARPRASAGSVAQADSIVTSDLIEVRTAAEVDTPARLEVTSLVPHYPDSLYAAGISGRVVVEIVVDTAGAVERSSVELLFSTDPRFTDAVRDALITARFTPGVLRGKKVRQFVQLPYNFRPGPG